MQKNKHTIKPNNKKSLIQDEDMDFFGSDEDTFDPCGAKDCVCAHPEIKELIESMASLTMMAEMLDTVMENTHSQLERIMKSKKLKDCPNIPMPDEDDDSMPF